MSAFLLGAGFKADMGTQSRKLVLLKLIDACDDDGTRIFPAMATVARAAQCSTRQVQREIKSFLAIGLLRLVRAGGNGPKSTNEYSLDLDVLFAITRDGWDAYAASIGASVEADAPENKGDTMSPLENKGDIDDALRVTPETLKGDNGSHTTPPYPSNNPSEERARERDHSGSVVNADLTKRVQKFCTGDGYREGEWAKWATSTIGHIAKEFAKLAPEEQRLACEWRDAFLAKCKRDRVTKPMPVANYFRDKVWEMLTEADKAVVRPVAGGAPAVSGGKVAVPVFGPAFAAARAWALVKGPVYFELPDDLRGKVTASYEAYARASSTSALNYRQKLGLFLDDAGELVFPDDFEAREWERRKIDEGYPEVIRLHAAAKDRNHVTVEPIFERLKDLCEAVPVGSQMWERWRSYHEDQGWPFVPTPAVMKVVFFPKGGPHGLQEFEFAVREAANKERSDDHAA
ncbi:hypothetical protein [Rhizobium sp. BK602]|uniref:hypothetical protein n=1 Tax=Rhizobium sp. BK602 TaxID=2586986 RepID=UPI001621B731|nr:hypothetical protein [Rhizobium sp. BK602]MBB3608656.1 hypothetical protein [Rhizobium sp. BK602]